MRASNCDRCYRRKGKCDRGKPCSTCVRANVACTYHSARAARPQPHSRRSAPISTPTTTTTDTSDRSHRLPTTSDPSSSRAGPVSEVSFLSLNAAGERQSYLGSSSGVLFADLVQSALDVTVTRPASPTGVTTAHSMPPVPPPRRSEELPPKAVVEAVVRAYLSHDAIVYPFMLRSFLVQMVQRFYQEPGYHADRATPFEIFSFNMVLAIAMSRVQKSQWHIEAGPQWFNARAMLELNSVLANDPAERLQAILLLCQYRSCSPIRDNSASMWHLVGVAARLCIELGLHRESSYSLACVGVDASAEMVQKYQSQEIQRRCFWTVVAMDRIVSIVLGRPFALHDDDIDTLLPREESDRVMAPSSKVLGLSCISVSNKIFRYRLLCGRISVRLHSKKFEAQSREDAERATQSLADQLQEWHHSQPQLHGLQPPSQGEDQISCFLSPEWYDLLAANASLMLWRPYFSHPDLARSCHVLDRIFAAASSAIAIYADLHRTRKINYNWITLQSVFLAGLSYVSTVSQHFRQRRAAAAITAPVLTADPPLGDVIRTTRACSRVLVAVGERWDLPRHCHDVFDRLSDAVLADAMHCGIQATGHEHVTKPGRVGMMPTSVLSAGVHADICTLDTQSPSNNQLHGPNGGHVSPPMFPTNFPSTLTVDNEFLSCFDDLQRLHDDQYLDDSVMQLSQDWLGSLGVQAGP